jgi:RNA polymerase sigma-70 factor (TIGR02943 family)
MAQNSLPALPTQDEGPKGPGASREKAEAGAPKIEAETRLADPERWVDEYGDYLFKHALVRLRDPAKAEDMVQETFLVALKAGETFAGRASAKSWLLGILKNKICDYYRTAGRETSFTDMEFYSDEESDRFVVDGLFQGGWIHDLGPIEWSTEPGASLDKEVFWKTFHNCTSKMPRKIVAAFTLRELDGIESKEICSMLRISERNLWVMLHRARMALRRCLEINWFKKQA